MVNTKPRTLFDKIWDSHCLVAQTPQTPALIYIDTHFIHEVTSPQAFNELARRKLKVRRPERTFATMDHATPTSKPGADGIYRFNGDKEKAQVDALIKNCTEQQISLFALGDPNQGIVHVIGPEQGITQPGQTLVCGDSHTSTHGAFGAFAFGIGSSEVAQVLASQCLLQRKPGNFLVEVTGRLQAMASAKDLILTLINQIGTKGATGHVIEFRGQAISALNMEERMTVCNMAIEAGARAGLIAPDQTTFSYLQNRPFSPQGEDWQAAITEWQSLYSDQGATFDRSVTLDASTVCPMITYGTNPEHSMPITQLIPLDAPKPALDYMQFSAGQSLLGQAVDLVFIGSCTNGRISDLRQVAELLANQRVAPNTRMLIVPGSMQVKAQAEREGLDVIFIEAGAEWRQPGCSMCLGMNGDLVPPGKLCVSTSNRNFEGRQGPGARTLLASPITAALAAIAGKLVNPHHHELTRPAGFLSASKMGLNSCKHKALHTEVSEHG